MGDSMAALPLVVNSFCVHVRERDLYAAIFVCVGNKHVDENKMLRLGACFVCVSVYVCVSVCVCLLFTLKPSTPAHFKLNILKI